MHTSTQLLTLLLATFAAAGQARAAPPKVLNIGAARLTVQAPPAACAKARRPARELARYLSQYDPAGEPRADIDDEAPLSRVELDLIRQGLVEHGLRYPNGQDSMITWMDADGDGMCDFTASAGFGGMRAIDRMFLFRGLPKGEFQLAAADFTYMEGSITPVPYIAIAVAGEKLPVLARKDTLLQWQPARKQFASCSAVSHGPQAAQQRAALPLLAALCPHAQTIHDWAAGRLPHKNTIPYTTGE